MTKTVGGVAAGLALALIVLFAGEYVARYLFPLPPDVNLGAAPDPKALLTRAPAMLLVALLAVHAIAAALGGTTAGVIAKDGARPIYIAVGLYLVGAFAHVVIVPHPIWFVMAAAVVILAVGYGLGRLAAGESAKA